VIGVSENDKLVGIICGYIIADGNPVKRFFSRRAIVPGGALLSPDISDVALEKLLKTTQQELSSRAIYIEFRNYNDYSAYRPGFESAGFSYVPHLNFHVPTPDVETTLKQLSTTKRRDVKLSRKEGADWVDTSDKKDVYEYYNLLSNLYKTRIKTPLFPVEFFEKLFELKVGKLFIIKYNNKIIGGSICVLMPNQTVYEWFVCGLDGQIKNVFPSTMATWAAIEFAASNGFKRFDMMGAGKPDEGYGVREFKSKFGGTLVEHGRFLYICKPRLYSLGKYIVKKLKSH
jgi:predicted N-acyltransferase